MKQNIEHIGEVLVALAAAVILISCVVVYQEPLSNFFNNVVLAVTDTDESTEPHTHDIQAGWSSDNTRHWHECTGCGKHFDVTAHDFSGGETVLRETTCDQEGEKSLTCTVCGKTITRPIPKKGHTLQIQTENNATCEQEGNKRYWVCQDCGKVFFDSYGQSEVLPDSVKIPALGHNWNAPLYEWSADLSKCTATRTCTRDVTHKEIETVTTTNRVVVPATEIQVGVVEYQAVFTKKDAITGLEWATTQTKRENIEYHK